MDSARGQRFGVVQVLEEPQDLTAIKVQWYDAEHEFGQYQMSLLPDGKPWTQQISRRCIITTPFVLPTKGHLPPAVCGEMLKYMPELDQLQMAEEEDDMPSD